MARIQGAPFRIGLAGLGTVGGEVARRLLDAGRTLDAKAGRPVVLAAVSTRTRSRDRGCDLSGVTWHDDPASLAAALYLDCVVELIGGAEGSARATVEAALDNGRHVVTANKALTARHGQRLAAIAEEKAAGLAFEAAVAGGIPIIKALAEGLAGNRIARVAGILNGTCNFILTQMEAHGTAYADALAEAQRLGYAEADPAADVDGHDSAQKLGVLSSLAFGHAPDLDGVTVEGITRISPSDIRYARELGYRIKLLGVARRSGQAIEMRVHPAMVPLGTPLADVDGVFNAVMVEGDPVGLSFFEGRGAGAGPTASAVLGDIIDLARGALRPAFGVAAHTLLPPRRAEAGHRESCFYLRFQVVDRPGVLAAITRALATHGVSVESMLQRGRAPGEEVAIVLTTHQTAEGALAAAVTAIDAQDAILEPPCIIRMEAI